MKKVDEGYITPEELEKRGFVREKDGMFYKLNTLERYGRDGWLDFGDKRYSTMDRISAGNRLGRDFYLSGLEPVSANDVRRVRVDGHGSGALSVKMLEALERFNAACRAVPFEFWGSVNRVCCEDRELDVQGSSERQKIYAKHRAAVLLCLGLDRLIGYYRRRE